MEQLQEHQQGYDEVEMAAIRRRRNILAGDLLLGRLLRYHPEQLSIIYETNELDEPQPKAPVTPIPVLTEETIFAIMDEPPKLNLIIQTVAKFYRLPVATMISHRRTGDLMRPRQIAMYLCRRLTIRSMPEIGRHFGGRDHTTIMHGARKIEQEMKEHDRVRDEIEVLIMHIRDAQLNARPA